MARASVTSDRSEAHGARHHLGRLLQHRALIRAAAVDDEYLHVEPREHAERIAAADDAGLGERFECQRAARYIGAVAESIL